MADPNYVNYSINDFDRFDCLKLSKGIYWSLLFVLRGYVVWLFSVANMNDHVGFLSFVFPDKHLFYLNLISGLPGLFVFLLICLRRPNAASWVRYCWRKSHYFLFIALIFDLFIMFYAYYNDVIQTFTLGAFQLGVMVLFTVYFFTSKRLSINLTEFPEPFDELDKKTNKSSK